MYGLSEPASWVKCVIAAEGLGTLRVPFSSASGIYLGTRSVPYHGFGSMLSKGTREIIQNKKPDNVIRRYRAGFFRAKTRFFVFSRRAF
jgi:hypothetical protein